MAGFEFGRRGRRSPLWPVLPVARVPNRRAPGPRLRRFQIARRRLAPYAGFPLNPPERPAQPPQRHHLLFLLFAQDIAHVDGAYPLRRGQCPASISYGRFSGVPHMAGFGCPPRRAKLQISIYSRFLHSSNKFVRFHHTDLTFSGCNRLRARRGNVFARRGGQHNHDQLALQDRHRTCCSGQTSQRKSTAMPCETKMNRRSFLKAAARHRCLRQPR